jgi:hypothetical protein
MGTKLANLSTLDKIFPFRKDTARLMPGAGLFRKDSWRAIAKSAPESVNGMGMFMPVFAYMAAKEPPGAKMASFGSELAGVPLSFVTTPFVTAACSAIPGFSMLPVGVRSFVGLMTTQFLVNQPITQRINSGIRKANQYTNRKRSLEMGGSFQDSDSAAESRMAAVQDMSSSFGASRRYLGREALLLHG